MITFPKKINSFSLSSNYTNKGLRGSSPSSEERNQPRRSLNEQNEAILKAMLGKDSFKILRDECLHDISSDGGIPVYGRCDILRFPFCTGDKPKICFNRVNRQDSFWPDKHPRYYIDYNRVLCYPENFTCSSCSPGRWCAPEGRCILDEKMYDCWAAEDAAAEQDEVAEDEVAQMEARASGWVGAEADEDDDDVGE